MEAEEEVAITTEMKAETVAEMMKALVVVVVAVASCRGGTRLLGEQGHTSHDNEESPDARLSVQM